MRGSLSVEDSYDLSKEDIELLNDLIKENIETAKKSGQPFF
tara:strand:- start:270 stop:392 length:123 start_codon:yes stop_codon:yes gene_type:complete